MLKSFFELIFACHAFGFGFGTLNKVSMWIPTPSGDEISMVQVHAQANARPARQLPKLANDKVHSFVNISSLPIYGFNRVHPVSSHEKNTWMVMFPETYTEEMLGQVCSTVKAPGKCIYVGHPDDEGLAFITVQSDFVWLSSYIKSSCSNRISTVANMCAASYIEVDGPTFLSNSPYPVLRTYNATHQKSVAWGLDRTDQRVGVDHAYNPTFTGEGIHVFHLDTGIKANLQEFEGRAIPTLDMTFGMAVACRYNDFNCATDKQGHGTHTAGTIASKTYGIAKKATIHAVKVLSDNGIGAWSYFVGAMDWVIKHVQKKRFGRAIISASLGGSGPTFVVTDAVNRATNTGIAVVVAAGNEAMNACFSLPASVKSSITVGSTDFVDAVDIQSDFSNDGPCLDIFAPGRDIVSVGLTEGVAMVGSGTSMACPHVAGVVALIFQQHSNLKAKTAAIHLKKMATRGCIGSMFPGGSTPNRLLYFGTDTNLYPCGQT